MNKPNLDVLRTKKFDITTETKFNEVVSYLISINESVAMKRYSFINDWNTLMYHKGCWGCWYRTPEDDFNLSDFK